MKATTETHEKALLPLFKLSGTEGEIWRDKGKEWNNLTQNLYLRQQL